MSIEKTQPTFEYKGVQYPEYIRQGNAVENVVPFAQKFCKGVGLDIGGTPHWHFPGAVIVNTITVYDEWHATNLPDANVRWDYIFSSHCLEHLENYVKVLELWRDALRTNGQLFLYLPHSDMRYWKPQHCRKHLHSFWPSQIVELLHDLDFIDIFYSERDLYYSFAVTGVKKY